VIVVADTSPLCYLILIGEIDLLPKLFGAVSIPRAVAVELQHPSVPAQVADWMANRPGWLRVAVAGREKPSPELAALDSGELEAIQLAQGLGADLVILDDKAAREAAKSVGLSMTGTLGILDAAARRKLVDLPAAVARLRRTNFRVSPALLRSLLQRNR
jgi:predicted nucleic acid-binding protein